MRPDLSFGRWLKHRRLDLNLTQAELARRVNYSTVTIRKIESDDLRPSRQMAEKLADQLELDPEGRTAFIRFARGEAGGKGSKSSGGLSPHSYPAMPFEPLSNNLPVPTTKLVGRLKEVDEARRLLSQSDVRLITFTGVGGTGKTRLGLQVAEEASIDFADGVYFVDLAPIADPAFVIPTIAVTLEVRETPGRALLDTLSGSLRAKRMLLLLDNFEQVLAAADQVARLLRAAPHLKVLVTSRIPLRLRGEHQFPVPPLAVPAPAKIGDPPALPLADWASSYAAVELFVRCAKAVRPDFALNTGNALTVAEICARLDGVPLAIELAAARIRAASASDLLDHLGSWQGLLAAGGPDLPARQRTLRNTLNWSHNLLSVREQALFRRLSVFNGGCTIAAIEHVCHMEGESASRLLDTVASLLDQNMLRQTEAETGQMRFNMLETIREFATEQLYNSGEAEAVHEQHACYFLRFAEETGPLLRGPQQITWLQKMDLEHDNVRAALRWSIDRGQNEVALRLVGALRWFWTLRSHLNEGMTWADAVLAQAGSESREWPRAKALYTAGVLVTFMGDSRARPLLQASVDLWRELGDKRGLAYSLHHLGLASFVLGDPEFAREVETESIVLFRELRDRAGLGLALLTMAFLSMGVEEDNHIASILIESMRVLKRVGDSWGLALALRQLGRLRDTQREHAEARSLFEQSVALQRELSSKHELAETLLELGQTVQRQGDHDAARMSYLESLKLSRSLDLTKNLYHILQGLATLAQTDEGVALLEAAAEALQAAIAEREDETPEANHGDVDVPMLLVQGKVMSLDEICDYALGG